MLSEVLTVADAIPLPMAGPGVDGSLSQHGSVRMSLQWGCSRTRNLLLRRVCHAALIRDRFWPKNHACWPLACPGIQRCRRRHAATPLTQGEGAAWRLRVGLKADSCEERFACLFQAQAVFSHQVCADGSVFFCRRLSKAGLSGCAHHMPPVPDPSRPIGTGAGGGGIGNRCLA